MHTELAQSIDRISARLSIPTRLPLLFFFYESTTHTTSIISTTSQHTHPLYELGCSAPVCGECSVGHWFSSTLSTFYYQELNGNLRDAHIDAGPPCRGIVSSICECLFLLLTQTCFRHLSRFRVRTLRQSREIAPRSPAVSRTASWQLQKQANKPQAQSQSRRIGQKCIGEYLSPTVSMSSSHAYLKVARCLLVPFLSAEFRQRSWFWVSTPDRCRKNSGQIQKFVNIDTGWGDLYLK